MCTLLAPLAVTMLALVRPQLEHPRISLLTMSWLVGDNGWAGVGYNNHISTRPSLMSLRGRAQTQPLRVQVLRPGRPAFTGCRIDLQRRANFIPWTLPGRHINYSMLPKSSPGTAHSRRKVAPGLHPAHTPVARFQPLPRLSRGGGDHNTSRFATTAGAERWTSPSVSWGGSSGTEPFPYEWPVCKGGRAQWHCSA